uniref:Uncharacterized protein n=1 Tax=Anguilla anguilla TaxID=7936 RepID=A0A0E9UUJ3_ANGAN
MLVSKVRRKHRQICSAVASVRNLNKSGILHGKRKFYDNVKLASDV